MITDLDVLKSMEPDPKALYMEVLKNLSEGKFICYADYEDFRPIKVEILSVEFENPYWKCIKVRVLEEGLQHSVRVEVPDESWGSEKGSTKWVDEQRPFLEDRVEPMRLKNFE